jgi:hypothetical protein
MFLHAILIYVFVSLGSWSIVVGLVLYDRWRYGNRRSRLQARRRSRVGVALPETSEVVDADDQREPGPS